MKTVYVCSPFRSSTPEISRKYYAYAIDLTRRVALAGMVPITPHLYLPLALDDNAVDERRIGLDCGLELLLKCDCVLVGDSYGISSGMAAEIDKAKANEIPIFYDKQMLDEMKICFV